jgi:hypothetical protein
LANVSLAHLGADCVTGGGSPLGAELGRLGGGGLVSGVVDHHVEPLRSQLKRNAPANPARRTRNESHLIHARQSLKNKFANEHSKPRVAKRLKTRTPSRSTGFVTL